MPGAKIPVLEIERLGLTDDGRGFIVYDDGTNFHKGDWNFGGGSAPSGIANAWFKIHFVSSSTYGPTGMAYYIPCFSTNDL